MATNNQIAAFLYLCSFNLSESDFGSNREGPAERAGKFDDKLESLGYPRNENIVIDSDGAPMIEFPANPDGSTFEYWDWFDTTGGEDWSNGEGKLWDAAGEAMAEEEIDLDAIINKLYAE